MPKSTYCLRYRRSSCPMSCQLDFCVAKPKSSPLPRSCIYYSCPICHPRYTGKSRMCRNIGAHWLQSTPGLEMDISQQSSQTLVLSYARKLFDVEVLLQGQRIRHLFCSRPAARRRRSIALSALAERDNPIFIIYSYSDDRIGYHTAII